MGTAAPLFFLLVICPNVIVGDSLGDFPSSDCPNLAPGIERMALGVDITELDLYHEYKVDAADGFVNKIIEYTCAEGKTWKSPYDGNSYQVPDQVDDFSAVSASLVISEAHIYSQKNDMKKEMAIEVGLDPSSLLGVFSASLTYKSSFLSNETLDKATGSNKAHINVARARLASAHSIRDSGLSQYFVSNIGALPPVFNGTSEKEYFRVIKSYGTHYFQRGNFGGSLSIWFAINKSLSRVMTSEELRAQVEASSLTILKAHGAYNGTIAALDERFTGNSNHTERYFGGQASLFDSEGFGAWWLSMARNPWLHSGSLVPLTDLLDDSNPRKTELVKAIEAYKLKSNIHETRALVQLYRSFHSKYAVDLELRQALRELNDESISVEAATGIDRRVQEYVITPIWFNSTFKLCLSASGQVKHCTPLGKEPDKTPENQATENFTVTWDVDASVDPYHYDIVASNSNFFLREDIVKAHTMTFTREIVYGVNPISAPAWIKYTRFGVRFDHRNGTTSWYLNDPFYEYRLISELGDTYAFFVVLAPL